MIHKRVWIVYENVGKFGFSFRHPHTTLLFLAANHPLAKEFLVHFNEDSNQDLDLKDSIDSTEDYVSEQAREEAEAAYFC